MISGNWERGYSWRGHYGEGPTRCQDAQNLLGSRRKIVEKILLSSDQKGSSLAPCIPLFDEKNRCKSVPALKRSTSVRSGHGAKPRTGDCCSARSLPVPMERALTNFGWHVRFSRSSVQTWMISIVRVFIWTPTLAGFRPCPPKLQSGGLDMVPYPPTGLRRLGGTTTSTLRSSGWAQAFPVVVVAEASRTPAPSINIVLSRDWSYRPPLQLCFSWYRSGWITVSPSFGRNPPSVPGNSKVWVAAFPTVGDRLRTWPGWAQTPAYHRSCTFPRPERSRLPPGAVVSKNSETPFSILWVLGSSEPVDSPPAARKLERRGRLSSFSRLSTPGGPLQKASSWTPWEVCPLPKPPHCCLPTSRSGRIHERDLRIPSPRHCCSPNSCLRPPRASKALCWGRGGAMWWGCCEQCGRECVGVKSACGLLECVTSLYAVHSPVSTGFAARWLIICRTGSKMSLLPITFQCQYQRCGSCCLEHDDLIEFVSCSRSFDLLPPFYSRTVCFLHRWVTHTRAASRFSEPLLMVSVWNQPRLQPSLTSSTIYKT